MGGYENRKTALKEAKNLKTASKIKGKPKPHLQISNNAKLISDPEEMERRLVQ